MTSYPSNAARSMRGSGAIVVSIFREPVTSAILSLIAFMLLLAAIG
jgi:hypothetical protein